jgi:hypothetical protein
VIDRTYNTYRRVCIQQAQYARSRQYGVRCSGSRRHHPHPCQSVPRAPQLPFTPQAIGSLPLRTTLTTTHAAGTLPRGTAWFARRATDPEPGFSFPPGHPLATRCSAHLSGAPRRPSPRGAAASAWQAAPESAASRVRGRSGDGLNVMCRAPRSRSTVSRSVLYRRAEAAASGPATIPTALLAAGAPEPVQQGITTHQLGLPKAGGYLTSACTCQPPQIPVPGCGTWWFRGGLAQKIAGQAAAAGNAQGIGPQLGIYPQGLREVTSWHPIARDSIT